MSILRESFVLDDVDQNEHVEEYLKSLKLVKKVVEVKKVAAPFVTTHFWCRTCKQKTPVEHTKTCDCGMVMCIDCWDEWESTCPICDKTIG